MRVADLVLGLVKDSKEGIGCDFDKLSSAEKVDILSAAKTSGSNTVTLVNGLNWWRNALLKNRT